MPYTKQYAAMIEQVTSDAARECFKILFYHHIGKANLIEIEKLTRQLYGDGLPKYQRLTRDLIENLRSLYFVPVMSDSGTSGRWLAESEDEINTFIDETRNRIHSLECVIAGMEKAKQLMREGSPQYKTLTTGQITF